MTWRAQAHHDHDSAGACQERACIYRDKTKRRSYFSASTSDSQSTGTALAIHPNSMVRAPRFVFLPRTLDRQSDRRLAFGTSPSPEDLIAVDLQPGANKIQQLEVWNPGELETHILM